MNPENEERLLKTLESIADSLMNISKQLSFSFELRRTTIANSLRDICQHLSQTNNYLAPKQKYSWPLDEAADELKITIRTLRKHCQGLGINIKKAELDQDDLFKLRGEIEKAADATIANLKQVKAPTAEPKPASRKKKGRPKSF